MAGATDKDKDEANRKLAQILNAPKTKNLQTSKPPIPSKSSKPGFMKKWKGGAIQATAPNADILEKQNEVSPKTFVKGKSEIIQQPAPNTPNENFYTTTPKPSVSTKPLLQPKPLVPPKPVIPTKPIIPPKPTTSNKPLIPQKPTISPKPQIPPRNKCEGVTIHAPPHRVENLKIQNELPPNNCLMDKDKSEMIHPLTPNPEICENYYTTIPEPQIPPLPKKISKWGGRIIQASTPSVEILHNQNEASTKTWLIDKGKSGIFQPSAPNAELSGNYYSTSPIPSQLPKPKCKENTEILENQKKELPLDGGESKLIQASAAEIHETPDEPHLDPKPNPYCLSLKKYFIFFLVPFRMCVLYYMDILSDIMQSIGLFNNCHVKFFSVSLSIILSSYMITVLYVRFVLRCSWSKSIFYFVIYG